jgi:hypothetical protein
MLQRAKPEARVECLCVVKENLVEETDAYGWG